MSVVGNFTSLEKIAQQLRDVASSAHLEAINRRLSSEALSLIKQGFSKSKAPDGSAWAPLKHRKGMPLRDTGRLGNSYHLTKLSSGGFTVSTEVAYATYHQTGTKHMPARPMVPEGALPPAYQEAFTEVVDEYVAAKLAP